MLNTSYIVASALTAQVGSCTTNGNDPNLPFTNNRTNNGNHDAAGNVRWDGATTYAFDAENRVTSSTRTVGSLTTAVNYKYDGDGRRVRVEVTGGASTNFVYDAGGKLLAEYNSQNHPESGTRFRIGDRLGEHPAQDSANHKDSLLNRPGNCCRKGPFSDRQSDPARLPRVILGKPLPRSYEFLSPGG